MKRGVTECEAYVQTCNMPYRSLASSRPSNKRIVSEDLDILVSIFVFLNFETIFLLLFTLARRKYAKSKKQALQAPRCGGVPVCDVCVINSQYLVI